MIVSLYRSDKKCRSFVACVAFYHMFLAQNSERFSSGRQKLHLVYFTLRILDISHMRTISVCVRTCVKCLMRDV